MRLAALAEFYTAQDPNTALLKVRQFAETLLQRVAARVGVAAGPAGSQLELIRSLEDRRVVPRDVAELFHHIRKAGNEAAHQLAGSPRDVVHALRVARQIGLWFHRTFVDPGFKAGPFIAPAPATDRMAELRSSVEALRRELEALRAQATADVAAATAESERRAQETLASQLAAAAEDRDAALALAEEMERQLADERERSKAELESVRQAALEAPESERAATLERSRIAANALELDEADTLKVVDEQLRGAGWEADSEVLRYSAGARPQKGRDLAIAEWPTASGPADYVLFSGLTPLAIVEAKRKARQVPAILAQAARYAKDFTPVDGLASPGGPWGKEGLRIPFLFATNGRAFLRQIIDQSGIWFRDARRDTNHARALEDWYTPRGLLDLLAQDAVAADATLRETPSDYLPLREYQHAAICSVEEGIAGGRREMLLAMATGTGKTRTLLGLVYRLIKAKRFRRVLFLVDRTALGNQAFETFSSVRLEGIQTFADIYDVKDLGDLRPDAEAKVHIATVQGMVRRLLGVGEGEAPVPVDAYDCVVVDECHRGYVLDRELGTSDLGFRNEADYISKYRRVLDHFDAVKIGLTATPALHTTEIFGAPMYQYSYRQAVIDGWLVDHEPPVRIETDLSRKGIRWQAGEHVPIFDTAKAQVELFRTPDELAFDVEDFNRKVVTENFNRVVCTELARQIDPAQPGKTLVFCATDAHADMVVRLLTEAFEAQYGSIEHDTVAKVTAAAGDPSALLRRYKNERRPVVAVTVDLLTTGIDVPEIVNVVFLRRVKSRILYEQMLGRATRLRPDLYGTGEDKEVFRIYDAVDLYSALEPYTAMTPVVRTVAVSVSQLLSDLERAPSEATRRQVHDELVAALRRRRPRLQKAADLVNGAAGLSGQQAAGAPGVATLIDTIRRMTPSETLTFLKARPQLVNVLDRHGFGGARVVISQHEDRVVAVEHGYGSAERPEDYLEQFRRYLTEHLNEIPALLVVTQRPRDLTRAQLRELKLALDSAGYSEASLRAAFRDVTNQDIAASIVGYVRRQALGDPLVPYAERVAGAVKRILASRPWTDPQRRWLTRIGQALDRELVIDRVALDREQFREQGGGFDRLNKVFDGKLPQIIGDLQDALWRADEPRSA